MGAGSHIVASGSLYGGSHNLLRYTLPRFGIETTFVNPRDVDAFRAAIRPNTRLLFGETLGNPGLDVLDIPRVSAVAHEAGLPLLVDSTFTTPWLMRPVDLGADLVFHPPPSSSAATASRSAACWSMAAPSTGSVPAASRR
jgi:O-acetylhomoserine (thiol)-lyase